MTANASPAVLAPVDVKEVLANNPGLDSLLRDLMDNAASDGDAGEPVPTTATLDSRDAVLTYFARLAADLAAAREESALATAELGDVAMNLVKADWEIAAMRKLLRELRADMNAPGMHPLDFNFAIWTAAIDAALQEPRP